MENSQQKRVVPWLLHCFSSRRRQVYKVLEQRNKRTFLSNISLYLSLDCYPKNQEGIFFKQSKGVFFLWVFLSLPEKKTKGIKIEYQLWTSLELGLLEDTRMGANNLHALQSHQ